MPPPRREQRDRAEAQLCCGAVTPPWPQSAVENLLLMPPCSSFRAQIQEGQIGMFRTGRRAQVPVVEIANSIFQ